MKQSLQIKLSQQLALTPQLQQAIKLLQMSTLEMEEEIERCLLDNPLLDRGDEDFSKRAATEDFYSQANPHDNPTENHAASEGSAEEPALQKPEEPSEINDDHWLNDTANVRAQREDDDDDRDTKDSHGGVISLREHLVWQLSMTKLSMRDSHLVRFLIEALDDDGYLSSPLEDLRETLSEEDDVLPEEMGIALRYLQSFDPTGVGAQDVKECLLLQLAAQPKTAANELARCIVKDHLALLAARDFTRLRRATKADDDALKAAQKEITALNPRPGGRFSHTDTRYVVPDVMVRKIKGAWTAYINPDAYPRLKVNRLYAEILSKQRKSNAAGHLQNQLQEARWLIKNVKQRFDTILEVSKAIVERQRQFFEHGELAMRPLVLREIAETLELHESTISRVTNQKYMSTPRGVFELKYFFGSHVGTETGGSYSATATRALIKGLIAEEDCQTPLSDGQISEILGKQGVVVARRTVAKYRESQNIPPANLRKTL